MLIGGSVGLRFRSTLILTILFALLFAVLMAIAVYLQLPTSIVLALALGIVLLQYLLGPFLLDWIFRIHWVDPAAVDPELAQFIQRTCQQHGLKLPRFGIIEDGNPNAFTYGRYRGDARLVITRGILDLLTREEREAVVAHELGHIKNNDFIVMTLATAVPIVLYVLARSALYGGRARGRGGGYIALVAAASFVIYILSHYIAKLLSRVREYYADEVSAKTTRNPDALSSSLIKIAYGLARAPEREEDRERDARGMIRHDIGKALGIFDPGTARSMALAASASGMAFSSSAMEDAMYWDLWNPWGRLYELGSTHPLPAKRIRQLSETGARMGLASKYRFDRPQPESYWDEFLTDIFITFLPLLLPILVLLFAALGWFLVPLELGVLIGLLLSSAGLGLLLKTFYAYRRGFRDRKVADLVREIKVSSVRGVPARLRGKIIGRGVPGLFWSEDLVLQDETGFIVLDYHQPIGFLDFFFGLFKAEQFMGADVTAIGWYRRGPAPRFELFKVEAEGMGCKCWTYPSKLALGAILLGVGLGILLFIV
jgi:heat shock protein HtpX